MSRDSQYIVLERVRVAEYVGVDALEHIAMAARLTGDDESVVDKSVAETSGTARPAGSHEKGCYTRQLVFVHTLITMVYGVKVRKKQLRINSGQDLCAGCVYDNKYSHGLVKTEMAARWQYLCRKRCDCVCAI